MYVCKLMPLSLPHVLILYIFRGGSRGVGVAHPAPPPPKIGKNMIFHTKYLKKFCASLRSAQFFYVRPP